MGGIYILIKEPSAMGGDASGAIMWLYPSTSDAFVIESIVAATLIFMGGAGFFLLYNATKVSGRTKKGLGIAFFNAITATQKATARDVTTGQEREIVASPLTNFNVLVLDQNLKNNSLNLIKRNV